MHFYDTASPNVAPRTRRRIYLTFRRLKNNPTHRCRSIPVSLLSLTGPSVYPNLIHRSKRVTKRVSLILTRCATLHRISVTAVTAGISFVLQKARRKRGASNNVRRCPGYFAGGFFYIPTANYVTRLRARARARASISYCCI